MLFVSHLTPDPINRIITGLSCTIDKKLEPSYPGALFLKNVNKGHLLRYVNRTPSPPIRGLLETWPAPVTSILYSYWLNPRPRLRYGPFLASYRPSDLPSDRGQKQSASLWQFNTNRKIQRIHILFGVYRVAVSSEREMVSPVTVVSVSAKPAIINSSASSASYMIPTLPRNNICKMFLLVHVHCPLLVFSVYFSHYSKLVILCQGKAAHAPWGIL